MMVVFLFDNTFDGLLTAVFEAYSRRTFPDALLMEGEPLPLFCDEVFTVVTDEAKVGRVWRGLQKKLSTGALRCLAQCWLAEEAENRGIAYVQATLGKTPAVAAAGDAPMFVGGEDAVKERLWPMLTAMGKPVDVGSISASCAVKLISNLVGMANLAVLAEGLRVGQCAGIEPEMLLPLLADTGAHSFQMDVRGPWIARKDFMPRFALRLAHKDLRLGCEMAQRWKLETPLLNAARAVFARAEALGLGGQDCAAVSCVTEQRKENA